jgi:hypothetical protein
MIGLFQNETNQLCNEINRIDTMGDVNKLVTAYINPYIGEGGGHKLNLEQSYCYYNGHV